MKRFTDSNGETSLSKIKIRYLGLMVVFLIAALTFFLYSWECQLQPELVSVVQLDPACFPDGNIYEQWHAVYEAYDHYPGTWMHPHEYYISRSIDEWPEMDLENYTYIITYCQKIQSLSYYVWRENNVPTYTGAKEAHMVLEEEIKPLTVYIYRIPRMRINNPEI